MMKGAGLMGKEKGSLKKKNSQDIEKRTDKKVPKLIGKKSFKKEPSLGVEQEHPKKKNRTSHKIGGFEKIAFAIGTFAGVKAASFFYNQLEKGQEIGYLEAPVVSPKITAEQDGTLFAFVTDTHELPNGQLQGIVNTLDALQIDALLLGGDFSDHSNHTVETIEILSKAQTKYGIYGVDGNHDQKLLLYAAYKHYGITLLNNKGLLLPNGIYVAGTEDLWSGFPDVKAATRNAPEEAFTLLITHNPDLAMLTDLSSVDLTISGHTHGGQIAFFHKWAPTLSGVSYYKQRFLTGWCEGKNGSSVYVSNGLNCSLPIPRIGAPPQVILFRFVSTKKESF